MNYDTQDDSENLFIKELLEKYIYNWRLFVLAFVTCITIGLLYIYYTPKKYRVTSTILMKVEKNSIMSELSAFDDLTIFKNANREVENEIEILKSRPLLENVIRKLDLDIEYYRKTKLAKRSIELIDKLPFRIQLFDDQHYQIAANFIVSILSETEFEIKDEDENHLLSGKFGVKTSSPFGDFVIIHDPEKIKKYQNEDVYVRVTPLLDVVERYKSEINIGIKDAKTSIVTLTMTTTAVERAKKILANLIEEYNADVINDKNQISKNTAKFIKDRLDIINLELDTLEKNVESYKTKNKLTDLSSEASLFLEKASDNEKVKTETIIQIGLVDFLNKYLKEPSVDLLPINIGFTDRGTVEMIAKYNEIALQRNKIQKSTEELNPTLVVLNDKLNDLKQSLQQSLINQKQTLEFRLSDLRNRDTKINAKIIALPEKERMLHDIQRQQKIKETLFLYLLEKREETAISLAATISNVKVIEKAYYSRKPISPDKKKVFISGFLAIFIIPIVIIFLRELLNTKVQDTKDLKKKLDLPLLGNIPASKKGIQLVASGTDRSVLAEAFRLLETNLYFMLTNTYGVGKVMLITSSVKGEGKSFIASNLGITLGRSGKKVALLEMDLRSSELRKRLKVKEKKGITNYIKDDTIQVKDMICNLEEHPGLDIYPSGPKPPNPAELLRHDRVQELFSVLKKEYDYIIIDTPPVSLVADTLLLSSFADLCVYVVRSNYSDKRLLSVPKSLYHNKRFSSMAVLFNGINLKREYAYGYGYEEDPKTNFFNKKRISLIK